jgi:hypothetical protein
MPNLGTVRHEIFQAGTAFMKQAGDVQAGILHLPGKNCVKKYHTITYAASPGNHRQNYTVTGKNITARDGMWHSRCWQNTTASTNKGHH